MLGANFMLILIIVAVLVGAVIFIPAGITSVVNFLREQQIHNEKLKQERLKSELVEQELINEQLKDEFKTPSAAGKRARKNKESS